MASPAKDLPWTCKREGGRVEVESGRCPLCLQVVQSPRTLGQQGLSESVGWTLRRAVWSCLSEVQAQQLFGWGSSLIPESLAASTDIAKVGFELES